jgi:hypothetical protein
MKHTGLTLLFIALMATTAPRECRAQVGAELGLNMANLAIKSDGNSVKTTFKPGFAIGIPAGITVTPHVYFEPGLFFEMTGAKLTAQPTGKYSINTVTVPINIEFKTGEKCGGRFFIGIGPYIGYNVGGSYTANAYGILAATSVTLKIGTANTDDLKALDAGAGINFGYQLKMRLYARAHYQMGFVDLNPAADGNNSLKTSAFGVTVGYMFGRCDPYSRVKGFGSGGGNHWRGMSKAKYSTKRRYLRDQNGGY